MIKKYEDFISESNENDHNEEIDMSSGQLKDISEMSLEIIEHISKDNDIPAWVQNKISEAITHLKDVKQYYTYYTEEEEELCKKGKEAAKRKFKKYPSLYANMYASKICKEK